MCRKFHGAAFGTVVSAKREEFRWVKGRDLVARYRSSPGFERCFCRVCGSPVPGDSGGGPQIFLPAGGIDDDPGLKPMAHIFVGSKAPWFEITDALPQFEEWPPGYEPTSE
jgi:hypothetical protein